MKRFIKNNAGIAIILILFLFANAVFLSFYSDVWWDSSVYIGMGKYIFSAGKSGLWENSRPLVLPLILGMGWKFGFDAVYFGRLVSIAFSALTVLMTYILGTKLFSRKIGLIAAFFTAFSYSFLFFSPNILTEIPSAFFVLLVFYFFLQNRFFLMGMFSGLAVMTRMFQAFTFIGLGIIFIFYFIRKPGFYRKLFFAVFGASIIIAPYLLLNYHLYDNILLPFQTQSHLTKTTGWMSYQEYGFYIPGLIRENFFVVFLLLLPFFFRRNYKFYALVLTALIFIVIFSIAKHKEMRFMLMILPFLYLLTAHCIDKIYRKLSNKNIATEIFYIMAIAWLLLTFASFRSTALYNQQRDNLEPSYFQSYLSNNHGITWVTNPLYALYSNGKVDGLLYFYSTQNLMDFVNENKNNVDIVMFNSCDIPCHPAEMDRLCPQSRKLLDTVLSGMKKIYEKELNGCAYKIYRKSTS